MFAVRRTFQGPILILLLLVGVLALLGGCQGSQETSAGIEWQPLFGDFSQDVSPVVAEVGDIQIRQRMVDLFIDELPPARKNDYEGPDGERLALKFMIDQVLLVEGAIEQKLYNDQDVARQLIAQRRNTLAYAMRNYGLLRGKEPTEDELRAFFEENKDKYRQQGLVTCRHVECLNKADADLAYDRLTRETPKTTFEKVVGEMSVNEDTKKTGGNTGWFNKGGFVPFIRNSEEFTSKVYDLDIGLHPPIKVGDRWHVVEVTHREYERPQTFTEAKNHVMQDMLPGWQDAVIKDYLLAARKKYSVKMLGTYAPGQGATEEELFKRAMAITDPQKKLELLSMIHTDFPDGDRADDALFVSANVALETWRDRRIAARYLRMLIDEYPDSELIEDAKFLRENLNNPKVLNPKSIEDLQQN